MVNKVFFTFTLTLYFILGSPDVIKKMQEIRKMQERVTEKHLEVDSQLLENISQNDSAKDGKLGTGLAEITSEVRIYNTGDYSLTFRSILCLSCIVINLSYLFHFQLRHLTRAMYPCATYCIPVFVLMLYKNMNAIYVMVQDLIHF